MPKSPDNTKASGGSAKERKEERLAKALRANLHRRKAQARGRGPVSTLNRGEGGRADG